MKKNLLIVALAIFSLATVSCGKKADSAEKEVKDTVETAAPAAPATTTPVAEGDVLAQYEAFVDKYVAVVKKAQGGDLSSVQELTKLNEELVKTQEKFAAESATWTQEQLDKLESINQKMVDGMSN